MTNKVDKFRIQRLTLFMIILLCTQSLKRIQKKKEKMKVDSVLKIRKKKIAKNHVNVYKQLTPAIDQIKDRNQLLKNKFPNDEDFLKATTDSIQNKLIFDDFKPKNPKSLDETPYTNIKAIMKNFLEFEKSNKLEMFSFFSTRKSGNPTIMYPNYLLNSYLVSGFYLKKVDRSFEYFLIYQRDFEDYLYFDSYYVRFDHYSIFFYEFQQTDFFYNMVANEIKHLESEKDKLSGLNCLMSKINHFSSTKFVLFKIPLEHWTHPNNLENREDFQANKKNYLEILKDV